MNLRHFRYFMAVVEEGSFHKASLRLNIAQPALSRQIRDLEEDVGAPLLVRSSKGVQPSPAGEVLYEEIQRLLPQVELARTKTQHAADGRFGVVQVAFTSTTAELRFGIEAFASARRELPGVDFRFNLISSEQLVGVIAAGEIDVGLLYRQFPDPPGVAYRDLRLERVKLIAASDHPLVHMKNVQFSDLAQYDLIATPRTIAPAIYNQIFSEYVKRGLSSRIILEIASETVRANLVRAGIGISFFLSSFPERKSMDGLSFVEIDDFVLEREMTVMWNEKRMTPAVSHFVEILTEASGILGAYGE